MEPSASHYPTEKLSSSLSSPCFPPRVLLWPGNVLFSTQWHKPRSQSGSSLAERTPTWKLSSFNQHFPLLCTSPSAGELLCAAVFCICWRICECCRKTSAQLQRAVCCKPRLPFELHSHALAQTQTVIKDTETAQWGAREAHRKHCVRLWAWCPVELWPADTHMHTYKHEVSQMLESCTWACWATETLTHTHAYHPILSRSSCGFQGWKDRGIQRCPGSGSDDWAGWWSGRTPHCPPAETHAETWEAAAGLTHSKQTLSSRETPHRTRKAPLHTLIDSESQPPNPGMGRSFTLTQDDMLSHRSYEATSAWATNKTSLVSSAEPHWGPRETVQCKGRTQKKKKKLSHSRLNLGNKHWRWELAQLCSAHTHSHSDAQCRKCI